MSLGLIITAVVSAVLMFLICGDAALSVIRLLTQKRS